MLKLGESWVNLNHWSPQQKQVISLFIYLAAVGLNCSLQDLHCPMQDAFFGGRGQHENSQLHCVIFSSLVRDETQTPCIGSSESQPLDHQGSPQRQVISAFLAHPFGVYLHACMHAKSPHLCPNSLQPYGLQPIRFLCPWDSPGKNTGVGCHAILWGIFLTWGLKPPSLLSPALAGGFFTTSTTQEVPFIAIFPNNVPVLLFLEFFSHSRYHLLCLTSEKDLALSCLFFNILCIYFCHFTFLEQISRSFQRSDALKAFLNQKMSLSVPPSHFVIVNFMCKLDWTIECLNICSNIILDVSMRVFFG